MFLGTFFGPLAVDAMDGRALASPERRNMMQVSVCQMRTAIMARAGYFRNK